jgi:hypothetical protein
MWDRTLGTRLLSPYRPLVVLAAMIAALAHIPVIAPHLDEAPYMGVLFIVLTAACLVLAGTLLVHDGARVYALSILTCGLAVIGYAATRLFAFPMLADDVGNWLEPLGVVSIVAESVAVAGAACAIHRGRERRMAGGRTDCSRTPPSESATAPNAR